MAFGGVQQCPKVSLFFFFVVSPKAFHWLHSEGPKTLITTKKKEQKLSKKNFFGKQFRDYHKHAI